MYNRERERQRQRETETETETERDRQTETETETETDREREVTLKKSENLDINKATQKSDIPSRNVNENFDIFGDFFSIYF